MVQDTLNQAEMIMCINEETLGLMENNIAVNGELILVLNWLADEQIPDRLLTLVTSSERFLCETDQVSRAA
jgi:hypothetical protein